LFGTTEAREEEETKYGDVEAEIEEELKDIRKPKSEPLFASIKLDTPCGEWDSAFSLLLTKKEVPAYLECSDLLQDAAAHRARVVCADHLRRCP